MALKTIMLRRDVERAKAELEALREKDAEFVTREAELETAIAETETDEQRDAVAAEVEAFDAEKTAHENAKEELTRKIEDLENELAEEERKAPVLKTPEKKTERSNNSMNTTTTRPLPMNQRAFDALPADTRNAILAQDDVKAFLAELRSFKGSKRAISGGELTIRKDDAPETVLDRLNVFHEQTEPLKDYYEKTGNTVTVNFAAVQNDVVLYSGFGYLAYDRSQNRPRAFGYEGSLQNIGRRT